MTQASEHVPHQLPNDHTRVSWLLDGITCKDPTLLAGKAAVQNDTQQRSSFEDAAAYLVQFCPVAKSRTQNPRKRGAASISGVNGDVNGLDTKVSVEKTGVELRWYHAEECAELFNDQKDELREYRRKNGLTGKPKGKKKNGEKGKGKGNKQKAKRLTEASVNKMISSAVATALEFKAEAAFTDSDKLKELIVFMVNAAGKPAKAAKSKSKATVQSVTFKEPIAKEPVATAGPTTLSRLNAIVQKAKKQAEDEA